MEATRSSETSVNKISTRRHIPEDGILHSHRRENLKSYAQLRIEFVSLELQSDSALCLCTFFCLHYRWVVGNWIHLLWPSVMLVESSQWISMWFDAKPTHWGLQLNSFRWMVLCSEQIRVKLLRIYRRHSFVYAWPYSLNRLYIDIPRSVSIVI
jgi:hypothetical protein